MNESGERTERAYPRYEVNAYVDYTGTDVLLYHRIENVSLGGICIQTPSVEDIGTTVDLVLNFPDLGASFQTRGVVVWANREPPTDIGIRFLDLDEAKRETLRTYINLVRKR
jgi:uncharacterized protein (TIGR02266 family)